MTRGKLRRNDQLRHAERQGGEERRVLTQYGDVAAEMSACRDCDSGVFRDKTVLLPCDDPEWSSFTLFFERCFEDCGLKKIIPTSCAPDSKKMRLPAQPTLFETEAPQSGPRKAQTRGKVFMLARGGGGGRAPQSFPSRLPCGKAARRLIV